MDWQRPGAVMHYIGLLFQAGHADVQRISGLRQRFDQKYRLDLKETLHMSILPPFELEQQLLRGELGQRLKDVCEEQLLGEENQAISFSHFGFFTGSTYGVFLVPENPHDLFHLQESLADVLKSAGAVFKKRKNFFGHLLPLCRDHWSWKLSETVEQVKNEVQFPLSLPVSELALFMGGSEGIVSKTSLFNLFTFPRDGVNLFPEVIGL